MRGVLKIGALAATACLFSVWASEQAYAFEAAEDCREIVVEENNTHANAEEVVRARCFLNSAIDAQSTADCLLTVSESDRYDAKERMPETAIARTKIATPISEKLGLSPSGNALPLDGALVADGVSAIFNTSLIYSRSESSFSDTYSLADEGLIVVEPILRFGALGGFAIRSEGRLNWRRDSETMFGMRDASDELDFERGVTTLTKDFISSAIRLQVGDVYARPVNFQNTSRLLGFNISRDYQRLQPFRNALPTTRRTFFLDRPSRVDVYVDDELVGQQLLDAGAFDLDDFAGELGSPRVELEIRDNAGRSERISFSALTAMPVLAKGILDFGVAGGIFSRSRIDGIDYDFETPLLSAYAQYGLTSNINVGADFQSSENEQMLGLSGLLRTNAGVLSLRSGASLNADGETGFALGAGFMSPFTANRPRISLEAELRGTAFAPMGQGVPGFQSTTSRADRTAALVTGAISDTFTDKIYVAVGGSWRDLREEPQNPAFFPAREEWTAYASATYAISKGLSLGVTFSVDNFDIFKGETYAGFLRLRRNFGDTYSASITHNTRNDATAITANRDPLRSINRTIAQVRGEFRNGAEEDLLLSADVDYEGNRFTAYGYHFEDRTLGGGDLSRDSFVQLNTSIAFADGRAAIGRQSYSGGFAIVENFEDNPDSPVYIDDWGDSDYGAKSGALGPALVIDLTPYINQRIDVSTRSEQATLVDLKPGENPTSDASTVEIVVPDEFEQVLIYALPFGGSVVKPGAPETLENSTE